MTDTIFICAKSRWQPAIRREHALALAAVERGHEVVFVEQPWDVRAIGTPARGRWLAGLAARVQPVAVSAGIRALSTSTVAPGHRGGLAQSLEAGLLWRALRREGVRGAAAVVATTPWEWPALARLEGVRRVFDCADDWGHLIPSRRGPLRVLFRRIGAEADGVVVATEGLSSLFGSRAVSVVPNAAGTELLRTPVAPPAATRTVAYAGTLSERFDAELVVEVMERLPAWHLELYGQARYPGMGERPSRELKQLLARFPDRVRWYGPIDRDELASRLDRASVCVLPHRREGGNTGDSMKFYDYAARGRPIVSTRWMDGLEASGPPHLRLADAGSEFASLIEAALSEPAGCARDRRAWAERNTWGHRWPAWSRAVLGG